MRTWHGGTKLSEKNDRGQSRPISSPSSRPQGLKALRDINRD
jgi:hypothetical protein